jgi:DNA-binding LytR/AlgR family response regulator
MDTTLTNVLIVDDEPLARKILEKYMATLPQLQLVKSCQNAFEALDILRGGTPHIDLIFCDIKMPEIDGLSFIKSLNPMPKVILTTAYSEHALAGFDIGVLDYLLKPIAYDRFLKAVNRALEKPQQTLIVEEKTAPKHLFFKADKAFHKVFTDNIIAVEAYGNFVKIHTDRGVLVVADKISAIEELLDTAFFMRIHKSFIVSLSKIDKVEGRYIRCGGTMDIPIGASYRTAFLERLA